MTDRHDDGDYIADDEYANALLGDPGLALRVEQLAQLRAGNEISYKLDLEKLSRFIPGDIVAARPASAKQRWPIALFNLFSRLDGSAKTELAADYVKAPAHQA